MAWSRSRRQATQRQLVDVNICYRNDAGIICPPNEKQYLAHKSAAEHIFYGGAAYGGKSIWLVVMMLSFAAITASIECALFRRRSKELHMSLVPMALAMLPKGAYTFNSQLGKLQFHHNNSIVWFGHCARDADVVLYQSSNWRKLGIDEASHMTQFRVDYLTSRVRGNERQTQVLLASNPGGPGHGWLKRRFVKPTGLDVGRRRSPAPLEIWRPLPPKDDATRYMASRVFIPAYATDNVEGLLADPHYVEKNILPLGGAKARQLAYGDWDSNDGMMFFEFEAEHVVRPSDAALLALGFTPQQIVPWHVYPKSDWRPPPSATIYGSIDYGYGAPWAFHLHAILPGGHIRTFFEFYRAGVLDKDQARLARAAIERLMAPVSEGGCRMAKPGWIVYDPQMDNSREEVGLTETIAEVYKAQLTDNLGIQLVAGAKSSRISRIQRTKDALAPGADGFPLWQITAACEHLIRTLPELPVDEDNVEDIDESAEDHAYEGCSRFLEKRPIPPRVRPYTEVDELDPLSRAEQLGVLQRRNKKGAVTALDVTTLIRS